ncbi:hypothetical protein AUL38_00140 [Leucobacter sp. G161]|nr:hypothetical protein AUL38_00140 [Leucobacter sp. G161]
MFGGLAVMLLARFPIGVALLVVSAGGAMLLFGAASGLQMAAIAAVTSVSTFTLVAIPLFILMGEVLFRSGLMLTAISGLDQMLSNVKGRLAFLAVFGGGLMGVLSGSAVASTAVLGGSLIPEMQRRGYSPKLASGSVLAAGGLAMVLPPSAVVIVWGSTAGVPVGPLLIAGVVPGLLMAVGYALVVKTIVKRDPASDHGYIEAWRRPSERSGHTEVPTGTLSASGVPTHVVSITDQASPSKSQVVAASCWLFVIIVATLGSILSGIATTSEAAAIGVVLTLLAAISTKSLNWEALYRSLYHALLNTGMIFFLVVGASIYARVMSGSGLVRWFVGVITGATNNSLLLVIIMVLIVIVLGLFLESVSLLLITIPLFMPIVTAAGIDPLAFGIAMIISIQIGTITPPLGMSLFVMRKFVPPGVPMKSIFMSVVPFFISDITVVALVLTFPVLATWLPSIM